MKEYDQNLWRFAMSFLLANVDDDEVMVELQDTVPVGDRLIIDRIRELVESAEEEDFSSPDFSNSHQSVLAFGVGLGWVRIRQGTASDDDFDTFVRNIPHLGYHYLGVDDPEKHRGIKWNGCENPPDPDTAKTITLT